MRVTARQEQVLRSAADATGQTLTAFVLGVATERAEEIVERAHEIVLREADFQRFADALDGPVESMPTLRRYAERDSPFPHG